MKNEYHERIICGKCKNEYSRDIEALEVFGKHCELDQPLKVIVVKKFKCKKCKETENHSINIIKELKKEVI